MTNPAVGKPWVVPPVQQLLIRDLLTRARAWAPRQTITYRDLREHDYAEFFARIDRAAAMLVGLGVKAGDRIGVMDAGRLLQTGSLSELRAHPANDRVARFLGVG